MTLEHVSQHVQLHSEGRSNLINVNSVRRHKWCRWQIGLLPLTFAILPQIISAQSPGLRAADKSDSEWALERPNIEKLAQLTRSQGGTILFSVDEAVGYASAGAAHRIDLPPLTLHCPYRSESLSHDGRLLAFLDGRNTDHCRIALYDIVTGQIRVLIELQHGPSALSWSWDDSQIAFVDSTGISPSVRSVSVGSGSVRVLAPVRQLARREGLNGHFLDFEGLDPIQWSHSASELLADFSREVPTSQPNTYSSYPVEYTIEFGGQHRIARFADGFRASVSPVADRVAWYLDHEIVAENLDGSDRQVLANAPRWMFLFAGDFKGPLVWSPDGKQLVFGSMDSETCRDSVYLLHLDTKKVKRFLRHTCITIEDWR